MGNTYDWRSRKEFSNNDKKQLLLVFTCRVGHIRLFTLVIKQNTSTIYIVSLKILYFCVEGYYRGKLEKSGISYVNILY